MIGPQFRQSEPGLGKKDPCRLASCSRLSSPCRDTSTAAWSPQEPPKGVGVDNFWFVGKTAFFASSRSLPVPFNAVPSEKPYREVWDPEQPVRSQPERQSSQ